jgi:hypothetical protein
MLQDSDGRIVEVRIQISEKGNTFVEGTEHIIIPLEGLSPRRGGRA